MMSVTLKWKGEAVLSWVSKRTATRLMRWDGLEDGLEWRVALYGFIEGTWLRDVRHNDVIDFVFVLRVRGEEPLGFLDAADGDTDGVAIGRLEMQL